MCQEFSLSEHIIKMWHRDWQCNWDERSAESKYASQMSIHNKYRSNDGKCIIHKRGIMIYRRFKKCLAKARRHLNVAISPHPDRVLYFTACSPHFIYIYIHFFRFSIDSAYHYFLARHAKIWLSWKFSLILISLSLHTQIPMNHAFSSISVKGKQKRALECMEKIC